MANRRRKGRRTFGATRQLPSGRWQASYLAPDGKRRSADYTFPEAADVNAFLANIEAKMGAGDWRAPEPSRQTFGAYGDRFLAAGVSRLSRPYSPLPPSSMRDFGGDGSARRSETQRSVI
ncbi:MAG TPA: hypothetical protein VIJ34_09640 [Acidimicrobiales bacterium]